MAVCVRMVGQELRACVQYRPPLQCSRQRCIGPRRAVPQLAGGWGWRVQGSAAVRPADFAPTV